MEAREMDQIVIDAPIIRESVEAMASIGFNAAQIRKAAEIGLSVDNRYHWQAMTYCAALGEIDNLLKEPAVWIKGMMPI
ncbi:hypothetical protein LCGC14_1367850 [marine sediment metagenome]|uniref:Uncharacterized protein n=1 Tax=marine sediment metagenome TaxID=412755 RepID=A0A0F9K671_9ZZZZ